jgi:hypothetical protein
MLMLLFLAWNHQAKFGLRKQKPGTMNCAAATRCREIAEVSGLVWFGGYLLAGIGADVDIST